MAQALTRALVLLAVAHPAFAGGLPEHPPAPPARPAFPSDPPGLPPDASQPAVVELTPTAPQAAPAALEAAPAAFGAAPAAPESAPVVSPQPAPAEALAAPVNAPVPPEARIDLPPPPYDPVPGATDPDGFTVAEKAGLADLTRKYAARHGVPLALLHRIIMRESKYHPGVVHRRYYGLMQITHATARGMGYKGNPKGLLDAETNLAYATPYLANAWALADGDINRAIKLYAAGYYNTAKSRKMLGAMRDAHSPPVRPEPPAPQTPTLAAPPQQQTGFFDSLFSR